MPESPRIGHKPRLARSAGIALGRVDGADGVSGGSVAGIEGGGNRFAGGGGGDRLIGSGGGAIGLDNTCPNIENVGTDCQP